LRLLLAIPLMRGGHIFPPIDNSAKKRQHKAAAAQKANYTDAQDSNLLWVG